MKAARECGWQQGWLANGIRMGTALETGTTLFLSTDLRNLPAWNAHFKDSPHRTAKDLAGSCCSPTWDRADEHHIPPVHSHHPLEIIAAGWLWRCTHPNTSYTFSTRRSTQQLRSTFPQSSAAAPCSSPLPRDSLQPQLSGNPMTLEHGMARCDSP